MKKVMTIASLVIASLVVLSTGAMANDLKVNVYGWSGTLPKTLIPKVECKHHLWQKSIVYKKGEVLPTPGAYPDVWYYLSLIPLPNGGGVCPFENEAIGRRVFDRTTKRFIPSVNYWDSPDSSGVLIVKVDFNGIVWIREIIYNPNDFPTGPPSEKMFPEVWAYVYSIPIPTKPCSKDTWRDCPSEGRREWSLAEDNWKDNLQPESGGGCFITSTRW